MVKPAVERKNEKGEPRYAHSINKVTDTSLAEAVLRNGVIFNAEAAVVLSAPATYLGEIARPARRQGTLQEPG